MQTDEVEMGAFESEATCDPAITQAIERVPEPETWGYYAYDDAPAMMCGSGIGAYFWFDSRDEMLAFITQHHVELYWRDSGEDRKLADQEAVVTHIAALQAGQISPEDARDGINAALERLARLEWWGQFRDLTDGDGDHARETRAAFYESDDSLDDGDEDCVDPIPSELHADFVTFLQASF